MQTFRCLWLFRKGSRGILAHLLRPEHKQDWPWMLKPRDVSPLMPWQSCSGNWKNPLRILGVCAADSVTMLDSGSQYLASDGVRPLLQDWSTSFQTSFGLLKTFQDRCGGSRVQQRCGILRLTRLTFMSGYPSAVWALFYHVQIINPLHAFTNLSEIENKFL